MILVRAQANGKSGWFILDTGVSDLILNSKHYPPPSVIKGWEQGRLLDVHGFSQAMIAVKVQSFWWGDLHRHRFPAETSDLRSLETVLGREILGLIGMEVLRGLELIVDYERELLILRRPSANSDCELCPAKPDFLLPMDFQLHLPVLEAELGDSRKVKLGLDTGSSLSLLNKDLQKKLRGLTGKVRNLRYSGPMRSYEIPFTTVNSFDMGDGLEFSYWRFGFNPMSHFTRAGLRIDGLLGGDLWNLGVISMNFSDGKMSVWLRQSTFLQRYPELMALAEKMEERFTSAESPVSCQPEPLISE